jgi:hypothetical protein
MTTFQQQARVRKLIYTVLILGLFTTSLLHRRLVIEAKARDLQLREVDRGEVELTASAVRLLLTGSRGMAVTMLWWEVDKKFTKHKWNEVELLVNSITELQPYFITPWLFQSHNLAFNISVENDRPRDKYYYISRGLDRLAAGERRNSNPGNPDLRYHMGLFLQMKIGTSDEKVTMRCLLDLSSIDPVERTDTRPFYATEKSLSPKFAQFCKDNPRLIRRLREQLGYDSNQVINFLEEHREIPNRFSDAKTDEGKSALKKPNEQWPILPPADKIRDRVGGYTIPNRLTPTKTDFGISGESMDIFILSRTWFMYAQETLPPPPAVPGLELTDRTSYDPTKHRIPKRPNVYIFRRTPAQAAANHAEALQEEGWYDDKGWFIKDWFTGSVVTDPAMGLPVGEKIEFHSGRAWALSHKMHKDYGRFNNIYQDLAEKRRLEALAKTFREKSVPPLGPGDPPPPQSSVPAERMDGYVALRKIHYGKQYRAMVNYDAHIYESLGKGSRDAIMAFKLFTLAEPLRKGGDSSMTFYEKTAAGNYEKRVMPLIDAYNLAVELMLNVLLDSPGVRKVSTLQDEIYDYEIRYIRYYQEVHGDKLLKPLTLGMSQWGMLLHPPLAHQNNLEKFTRPLTLGLSQLTLLARPPMGTTLPYAALAQDQLDQLYPLRQFTGLLTREQRNKFHPIRDFRGPFDMTVAPDFIHADRDKSAWDDEEEQTLKIVLLAWSQGTKPYLLLHPGLQPRMLSTVTPRGTVLPANWSPLVSEQAVNSVRQRYRGLPSLKPEQGKPNP